MTRVRPAKREKVRRPLASKLYTDAGETPKISAAVVSGTNARSLQGRRLLSGLIAVKCSTGDVSFRPIRGRFHGSAVPGRSGTHEGQESQEDINLRRINILRRRLLRQEYNNCATLEIKKGRTSVSPVMLDTLEVNNAFGGNGASFVQNGPKDAQLF